MSLNHKFGFSWLNESLLVTEFASKKDISINCEGSKDFDGDSSIIEAVSDNYLVFTPYRSEVSYLVDVKSNTCKEIKFKNKIDRISILPNETGLMFSSTSGSGDGSWLYQAFVFQFKNNLLTELISKKIISDVSPINEMFFVDEDRVYFQGEDGLKIVNLSSGKTLWSLMPKKYNGSDFEELSWVRQRGNLTKDSLGRVYLISSRDNVTTYFQSLNSTTFALGGPVSTCNVPDFGKIGEDFVYTDSYNMQYWFVFVSRAGSCKTLQGAKPTYKRFPNFIESNKNQLIYMKYEYSESANPQDYFSLIKVDLANFRSEPLLAHYLISRDDDSSSPAIASKNGEVIYFTTVDKEAKKTQLWRKDSSVPSSKEELIGEFVDENKMPKIDFTEDGKILLIFRKSLYMSDSKTH